MTNSSRQGFVMIIVQKSMQILFTDKALPTVSAGIISEGGNVFTAL